MPDAAPPNKIAAVRTLGAEVELVSAARRDIRVLELVAEKGFVHVPPYDDPRIIAGQGTVGLELMDQLPMRTLYSCLFPAGDSSPESPRQ